MPRPSLFALLILAVPSLGQVHYHPNGSPWRQQARRGPDAEVEGWLYNLGITGIRVKLLEAEPSHLVVGHVFSESPAHRKVRTGDHIVGAGGRPFRTPHRNGYGMDVFGPEGPILDFAEALDRALLSGKGQLKLTLERDGSKEQEILKLPPRAAAYATSFPFDCKQTDRVRERLYEYLVENQKESGSWGNPVHNTFAPLALLSSGERKYLKAVERNVKFHAQHTATEDAASLVNWRYMAAGVVMGEWHLATGERWVLPELQEVYDFLYASQYVDLSQVSERVKESHPGAYPKSAQQQYGGWGHNIGFEGYGPIAMITAQGALTFALLGRCGIEVDEDRHRAAYEFLRRGTGKNGYLWYGDSAAGQGNWADMGRTGASGIAHWMSPFREHRTMAKRHAAIMAEHPESFPDTHASPLLGMGYGALGAFTQRKSFEAVMAANRWWFLLAECPDGSFHYQPNRDNAGYGSDARLAASAVAAFILSLPQEELVMTGKKAR